MGKWKWFQFDVFSSLNSIFPLKKTNKQSIKFCKQTSKLEKVLYKIDQTCVQPLRKTLHQTSQSVTLEIWNQSTCWRGGKSSGVKQNGCHCGLNCHITGYRFVSAGTLQTPNQHKPFNGASTQKTLTENLTFLLKQQAQKRACQNYLWGRTQFWLLILQQRLYTLKHKLQLKLNNV